MWAESVELGEGRATIRGEVWLGPVEVGDRFTSAATATEEERVDVRLEEITTPPEAQEPGRVPRVVAVVTGEGIGRLRPGVVLLGDAR